MKRRWVEEEDWETGDGHSRRVLGDRGCGGSAVRTCRQRVEGTRNAGTTVADLSSTVG
jgi:hypothetical protein